MPRTISSELAEATQEALDALRGLAGEPLEWSGRTVNAIPAGNVARSEMSDYGFPDGLLVRVTVARSDFPTTEPALRDAVTFRGAVWRVTESTRAPVHLVLTLRKAQA